MNSILETDNRSGNIETSNTAEVFEQNHALKIGNEDAKFGSEFARLGAASVTIASIATSIGLS